MVTGVRYLESNPRGARAEMAAGRSAFAVYQQKLQQQQQQQQQQEEEEEAEEVRWTLVLGNAFNWCYLILCSMVYSSLS